MNAQILNIKSKKRQEPLGVAAPTDFAFSSGSTISAQFIVENPAISLYCLDHENQRALFVETHIDLSKAPFYYQAQYENSTALFAVSYETLHKLAKDISFDSKRLILIYSVGRCGSTLLSSALNQIDNIFNLSEPDIYAQLVQIRNWHENKTEVNELIQSCTKILCKSPQHEPLVWAIKFRSYSIEIADLMFKHFPNAKNIFLYRDAETWLKSAFRAFLKPDALNSTKYLTEMQNFLESIAHLIAKRSTKNDKLLSIVEMLTLAWLSVMERYLILHQQGFSMFAVRYKELSTNPQQVIKEIFAYCGIPTTDLSKVFKALEKDSQAGSVLSRENMQKKAGKLPENYLVEIREILQKHPTIQTPHFIVPNTKCIS
jgi:hypothetical protein